MAGGWGGGAKGKRSPFHDEKRAKTCRFVNCLIHRRVRVHPLPGYPPSPRRTHSPRGRKVQPRQSPTSMISAFLGTLTDRWVGAVGPTPGNFLAFLSPRKQPKRPEKHPTHTSQGTLSRPGGVSGGVPPASGRVPEAVGRLRAGYIRYTGCRSQTPLPCPLAARTCCAFRPTAFSSVQGSTAIPRKPWTWTTTALLKPRNQVHVQIASCQNHGVHVHSPWTKPMDRPWTIPWTPSPGEHINLF